AARPDGTLDLTSWRLGEYVLKASNGSARQVKTEAPRTVDLGKDWNVAFAPGLGAPASARFPKLISWPESSDRGIRYFSGSATYAKEFDLPTGFAESGRSVRLDLGMVKNFATVSLNGKPLTTLWKP